MIVIGVVHTSFRVEWILVVAVVGMVSKVGMNRGGFRVVGVELCRSSFRLIGVLLGSAFDGCVRSVRLIPFGKLIHEALDVLAFFFEESHRLKLIDYEVFAQNSEICGTNSIEYYKLYK